MTQLFFQNCYDNGNESFSNRPSAKLVCQNSKIQSLFNTASISAVSEGEEGINLLYLGYDHRWFDRNGNTPGPNRL